ncbi:MAG: hypothetical protein L0211_06085 [Planctomycetaceae bacterium]|nr:hypothetical protein [Planctomycetaceae bacterium]
MTSCPFRLVRGFVLIVTTVLALGCGSGGDSKSAATGAPSAKQSLDYLVNLLNYLKSENKPPPAKVADIEPIEPLFQGAYLGLVRGEIDYVWGTTIDPAGADKVLAYEKAVESSSGWVLMQDASLKTMEASQFQAAPKAAK